MKLSKFLLVAWKVFLILFFFSYFDALKAQDEPEFPKTAEVSSVRQFKPWFREDYATGDWGGLRKKLTDKGIDLGVSSINEVWGNTQGGLSTGTATSGLLQFATAFDFEKLIGWKGASFYSRWLYLYGGNPSYNVGDIFTVSNISGYSTFRNINLWLEQKFLEDTISLRIGQLTADSDFCISDYGALFLNSTFGWPAFLYASIPNGGPNYPMGAPGVFFRAEPIKNLTFKCASFQGNVFTQMENNHGFMWNLSSENGYFYITEAAYEYDLGLPGEVKLGSWFYSGSFLNIENLNDSFYENNGFYAVFDQMLYRKPIEGVPRKRTDEGFGIFERIGFQPQNRNFFNFYTDTGFNYKGLLPTRNEDVFGVGFAFGQVSPAAQSIQNVDPTSTLAELISPGSNLNYEMVLEATYLIHVTHWVTLQPDIQYSIHPGADPSTPNAFIIGLRGTVTF